MYTYIYIYTIIWYNNVCVHICIYIYIYIYIGSGSVTYSRQGEASYLRQRERIRAILDAPVELCHLYPYPCPKKFYKLPAILFVIQICSTNWLGHGHGYKWHSSPVPEYGSMRAFTKAFTKSVFSLLKHMWLEKTTWNRDFTKEAYFLR